MMNDDYSKSENEWNSLQNLIAENFSSPLEEAIRLHLVKTLLESGKFDVNILTTTSQNLLHLFCLQPLNKCQFDYDGKYEIAKLLIENGININQKDERGKTPLMLACQNGYTSVVKALMLYKWMDLDVNARDSSGESAITIAGRNANYNFYARLITASFLQAVATGDVNTVELFRNSSTEECAKRSDDLCVNSIKRRFTMDLLLLEIECDNILDPSSDLERPKSSCITSDAWLHAIFFADNSGNESMLELLFDFEKIVRATTRSGLPTLHLAISSAKKSHRYYQIFEILVDSGRFDVNALTNNEETVLHVSCRCGDPEKLESIIELLIRNKVNVNQENSFGKTALMIACEYGNVVAVRKLLEWKDADGAKCDINVKDRDERTALNFAYQSNNTEVAEMIEQALLTNAIENGDLKTIEGVFAEECAEIVCDDQEPNAKKSIMSSEAEGNIPDKEWNILQRFVTENLSQQIKSKRTDLVETVLKSEKNDVNTLTSYSQNLLHLICLRQLNNLHCDIEENYQIAKLLIKNGVDVNQKDDRGKTPMMLACENGYDSVVKALLDWASTALDIDARDYSGETALVMAAHNKNIKSFSRLASELFLHYVEKNDIKAVPRFVNSSRNACAECFKDLCVHPISIVGILAKDFEVQSWVEPDLEYPSESCVTFNGWLSAVKIAEDGNNDSMLDLLVKYDEDVSGIRKDGRTALHLAVLQNQGQFEINGLSAFEILMKSKRFYVNEFTINLETVLHLACRFLCSKKAGFLMKQFLRYNVNVNQRNIFGETAFLIACKNENTVAVRQLLKWTDAKNNRLDIDARDSEGQTALSFAKQSKNKEIIFMIEKIAFLIAVADGNLETAKVHMKAINYNVLINGLPATLDFFGHSLWLEAVYMAYCKSNEENSHNDILKLLLNDNFYMHEPNEEGQTILHSAVEEYIENKCEPKGLRKIEILLNSSKCNVNALNSQKETVLHIVCSHRAHENLLLDDLLKILLENRVDLNLKNNSGETALLIACENGNTNIVRTLLTLTRNNDIYADVNAYGKPAEDENANDNKRCGQMSRVSNFIMIGDKRKWRQTYSFDLETWREAAILAIENSYEEILKLLLDYDAIVQRQYCVLAFFGYTILNPLILDSPLILDKVSSAKVPMKLYEKLLESGKVNVNALNFHNSQVLHEACKRYDYQELISLLLLHGTNVNHQDESGETPITYGIFNNCSHATRQIVNFAKTTGARLDIDAKNAKGQTALMQAAMLKHSDTVEMLLNAGASVNLTDNRGFTAMHHALHEAMSPETWINYGDFPRNIQELNQRKAINVILYETEPHKLLQRNVSELNEENIKTIKLLLKSDLDVNSLDCEGYSPMDIAVAMVPEIPSHIKDALKAKGAILNVFQNKNEHSESHAGLNINMNHLHRRANLLKLCTKERKDNFQFYKLKGEKDKMAKENFSKLSAKIQNKLISARDQKGRTPLHRAIISGQEIFSKNIIVESGVINVVKLLISLGCSVNETDIYGRTPLHYADFNELQNLLISHDADQTVKDENGIDAIKMSKLLLLEAAAIGTDRVSKLIDEICKCREKLKSICLKKGKIQIEWNKNFNPETIPKLLWKEGNNAFNYPSVNQLREEVKKFIEDLASEIIKRDPRFAVDPILVGSSNEETKLDKPDEFDFLFVLKKIGKLCKVSFSPELPSGFVRLKRKHRESNSTTDKDFDRFFDHNLMLISQKLDLQFQSILRNVLSDAQFIENNPNFDWDLDFQTEGLLRWNPIYKYDKIAAETLRLRNRKFDLGKRNVFNLSIDIVPCIHIDGWWPDEAISNVSEKIKAFGCNLVFDQPMRMYRWVPFSASCVKISFASAESEMIKRSSDAAKQAFMIAKQWIKKSKCDTSYTLKNSFLYCLEAFSPAFENASHLRMNQDALEPKFKEMNCQFWLENLMKCHLDFVSLDFCPCYFMPIFLIPVGQFFKGFHMRCLAEDNLKLPREPFLAYAFYRSVSLQASWFNFQLPPLNTVFEHFDREAMIANLRASSIENFGIASDICAVNETEQVGAADDDDDDDDENDDDSGGGGGGGGGDDDNDDDDDDDDDDDGDDG